MLARCAGLTGGRACGRGPATANAVYPPSSVALPPVRSTCLNVGILGPVTVSEFLPPALPTALTDFQQLALSALPRIAMAPTHAGALPSRAPPRARNPMPARITVQGAPIDVAHEDTPLARATTARVSLRLLPF